MLSKVAVTLTFDERISAGSGRCSVPSKSGSKMAVMVLTVRIITLVADPRKPDYVREKYGLGSDGWASSVRSHMSSPRLGVSVRAVFSRPAFSARKTAPVTISSHFL